MLNTIKMLNQRIYQKILISFFFASMLGYSSTYEEIFRKILKKKVLEKEIENAPRIKNFIEILEKRRQIDSKKKNYIFV